MVRDDISFGKFREVKKLWNRRREQRKTSEAKQWLDMKIGFVVLDVYKMLEQRVHETLFLYLYFIPRKVSVTNHLDPGNGLTHFVTDVSRTQPFLILHS